MNNDIYPCVLFEREAADAGTFYADLYGGTASSENPFVTMVDVFGQKLMLLNYGMPIDKTPALNLHLNIDDDAEVDRIFNALKEGGRELMPLGSYPWSPRYGWVNDRFGTSWQVYGTGGATQPQTLVPSLMFVGDRVGKCSEAMNLYTSTFPNSAINGEKRNEKGEIVHADFVINGYHMYAMDSEGPHAFDFNNGVSMLVLTDDQAQTDHYWSSLLAGGGKEMQCGWLEDRYGVRWQIAPKAIIAMVGDNANPEKQQRAIAEMMKQIKLEIAPIEAAYNG